MELFNIKYFKLARYADVVIYPDSNDHCQKLVELANKHNVVLIPYGGGTNVTNALELDQKEKRMIVSVDMSRMNKIKWVDNISMTACVEAGIYGKDL